MTNRSALSAASGVRSPLTALPQYQSRGREFDQPCGHYAEDTVRNRVGGGDWADERGDNAAGMRDVWTYPGGRVRFSSHLGARGGEGPAGLDLRPLLSCAPAHHRGHARLRLDVT